MDRKDVFKILKIGKSVNLTANVTGIGLGQRTVTHVRNRKECREIGFSNGSWLSLGDGLQYVKTENGFRILDEKGRLLAEYETSDL